MCIVDKTVGGSSQDLKILRTEALKFSGVSVEDLGYTKMECALFPCLLSLSCWLPTKVQKSGETLQRPSFVQRWLEDERMERVPRQLAEEELVSFVQRWLEDEWMERVPRQLAEEELVVEN
ncbi:hypothetical protein AVEN_204508-1 [Araneus ventricosus]|uniref:Uncharacterized protein n=1 Tax=Araneus ventricosus TaxID=182803 RepID=A0A4Y2Q260_ARAVE|nr:hypothetical protein AVEN_81776-1 [Araneus ventricosus]GBN56658.1 hypothetical protein AVEN_204508-1 [Araneus ventricosus]